MGTRVDFYVGRGEEAEWLGSNAWDGYPDGVFRDSTLPLPGTVTEEQWRAWVASYLDENKDSATTPDMGWPWPWSDSCTTDYAYALDNEAVWGSNFGYTWFRVNPADESWGQPTDDDDDEKVAVFPDMTARKAVTYGPRSGVMIFGAS